MDVDGLKAINDSKGHAAGDEALVAVVGAIQRHDAQYGLIVRMGGDEFICVLAGLDEAGAKARVDTITDVLDADPDLPSATFRVAEMLVQETPAELIRRVDADHLYRRRALRRS